MEKGNLMFECKDCKKKIEAKATVYFIDAIEGPINLCKYCANIRKEWWDNGWKEIMGAEMYDGSAKVDMTYKELHEAKDNYFKYGYENCMRDLIRNFINDLDKKEDEIIYEDFRKFLKEMVAKMGEEKTK